MKQRFLSDFGIEVACLTSLRNVKMEAEENVKKSAKNAAKLRSYQASEPRFHCILGNTPCIFIGAVRCGALFDPRSE